MKRYTFLHFCFDMIMTLITGGLWTIWLFFKFLRSNS